MSIGNCSVGRQPSGWSKRISPSRSVKGDDVLIGHVDGHLCIQIIGADWPMVVLRACANRDSDRINRTW